MRYDGPMTDAMDLDNTLRAALEADRRLLDRASPEERERILEERRVAREAQDAEAQERFLDATALMVGKQLHREPQRNTRVLELNTILKGETDRGFILVLTSYLELLLGDLLKASVAGGPTDHKEYLRTNSTLAARARAAAALGLISPAMSDDIDRIRNIRNELAHHWDRTSLDATIAASPELTRHLDAIHHDVQTAGPPRKRLHRAGLIVAGLIDKSIASTTRPVPPANFDEQEFAAVLLASFSPKLRERFEASVQDGASDDGSAGD